MSTEHGAGERKKTGAPLAAASGNVEAELRSEIERLKTQLSHAQRLSMVGELAGTLAHEFNNILTTTINYAKLGLRHKDDATREKSFEKILSAGQRAARLTQSVLGAARTKSDSREAVDVGALVEDSLLLMEKELQKYRVSVQRDIQPAPEALANAGQIQQVFMNLLVNARQAMPNGGLVTVGVKHDAAGGWIELSVRDGGCGIPQDKLPRIFDAFYTTKSGPDASGQGGTGLGLSACREIIEAHHGRIRVESSVGRGTLFVVKLPLAESATNQPSGPRRQAG
ncbi:MAG TPA: ATP-binding protein [Pirellulales bacterium]